MTTTLISIGFNERTCDLRPIQKPDDRLLVSSRNEFVRRYLVASASIEVQNLYGQAGRRDDTGAQGLQTYLIDLLVGRVNSCLPVLIQWHLKKWLKVVGVQSHVGTRHHLEMIDNGIRAVVVVEDLDDQRHGGVVLLKSIDNLSKQFPRLLKEIFQQLVVDARHLHGFFEGANPRELLHGQTMVVGLGDDFKVAEDDPYEILLAAMKGRGSSLTAPATLAIAFDPSVVHMSTSESLASQLERVA